MACTCTCLKCDDDGYCEPYECECPCSDDDTRAAGSSTSKIISNYESKLAACKGDKECIAKVEKEEEERLLKEKIARAKEQKEVATKTLAATIKAEEETKASYGKIQTGGSAISAIDSKIASQTASSTSESSSTSATTRDNEPDLFGIWYIRCNDAAQPDGHPSVLQGGHGCCTNEAIYFDEGASDNANYQAFSNWLGQLTSASGIYIYNEFFPEDFDDFPPTPPYLSQNAALDACATYCCQPSQEYTIEWVECKNDTVCEPITVTYNTASAYNTFLLLLQGSPIVTIYGVDTPTLTETYFSNLQEAIDVCELTCGVVPVDPCDYLNISVNYLSTTEVNQNTGTASVTVTWTWEGQTASNVPINLYDSAGNVLETIYIDSPESFMFTGLAAGSYSVGVAGNFQIEVNGVAGSYTVDVSECFVTESFEIVTEETVIGCMDENACNFNPEANTHDSFICEYVDCAGVCGGSATVDECGDCVVGIRQSCEEGFPVTGNCVEVACIQDCNGVWGGTGAIDDCGNCTDPNSEEWNSGCLDCNGIPNGPSMIDSCGNCEDPTDLTVWNAECQGCKEECALNYDPDAPVGCANCCISFDFKPNCVCDSTTANATVTLYWFHPQGASSPAGGPTGGNLVYNTGANYVYNSVSYTDTQTTIDIPDGTTWTTTQTPDGTWYSYADIEISSAAGTELPDGLYTLTFDSVIVQDGITGEYLTHEEGVSVKECRLILCGIENKLQTHFKNIILENKCCQCEELKDIWFKAWTLYRALKIASTCGIESHIPKTIKRINALSTLMTNKICNNC